MKDKFTTNQGKPSHYAFICGYTERIDINDENWGHICLEPNGYHVKGFKSGQHFWEIFERISEARKFLSSIRN